MPGKIMLIRHAEKPDDPPPIFGIDEQGHQDPEELSVRGWQRAGAIASLFAPWSAAARPAGLVVPSTIFASGPTQASKSKRPHHTVKPLAEVLGTAIDLRFSDGAEDQLVAAAIQVAGPVLIAWHHEAIPKIGNTILGNPTICPQKWKKERFDLVWVFDRRPDGWTFSQVPQLLLAGDSASPIPMKS